MCGIAGFINKKNSNWENKITSMCDCMVHRGPDGFGCWHDENNGMTLGHRRLSILDLSENGKQPMFSATGRLVIVFNGEIYNFQELKRKIKESGTEILYRSTSDTEVLIEAFEYLGIDKTLETIRGMFAIALYDKSNGHLYLMRDRMGEKPLYYGSFRDTFLFASSLDAVCSYEGHPEIDPNALLFFLCYGYIPGAISIYKGFKKVLPGECIEIDIANQAVYRRWKYWNVKDKAYSLRSKASERELTEELHQILSDVIKEQMVADVPVGAYLSGGVDSSLIVSIMQELAADKVHTYTIGIEGDKSDEVPWSQKVAEHLGVKHTWEYITKENMLNAAIKMGRTFCEPFADVSQVPTYMVSALAKREVTVTLSGDAGDELFCGYDHYLDYPKTWEKVKRSGKYNPFTYGMAKLCLSFPRNRYTDRAYDFKKKYECESLEDLYRAICESLSYGDEIINGASMRALKKFDVPLQKYMNRGLNVYDSLMLTDQIQYLPDDILVKVDSTGMALSLENRIPLLDRRIVEFSWTVPTKYKYDGTTTKKLLRNILYEYVPRDYIERPKQGFSFPALKWLIENLETEQWAVNLFETRVSGKGILNKTIVMQLWNEYLRKKKGGHIIWNLVMLLAWAEERGIVL